MASDLTFHQPASNFQRFLDRGACNDSITTGAQTGWVPRPGFGSFTIFRFEVGGISRNYDSDVVVEWLRITDVLSANDALLEIATDLFFNIFSFLDLRLQSFFTSFMRISIVII